MKSLSVSQEVPQDKVQKVKDNRRKIQDGLRLARIEQLRARLESMEVMDDLKLHRWAPRYEVTKGDGIRAPRQGDVFTAEAAANLEKFGGESPKEFEIRQKRE